MLFDDWGDPFYVEFLAKASMFQDLHLQCFRVLSGEKTYLIDHPNCDLQVPWPDYYCTSQDKSSHFFSVVLLSLQKLHKTYQVGLNLECKWVKEARADIRITYIWNQIQEKNVHHLVITSLCNQQKHTGLNKDHRISSEKHDKQDHNEKQGKEPWRWSVLGLR